LTDERPGQTTRALRRGITTSAVAGQSLVAVHDWTFLLGPGFCVGVNGLLLGYRFYASGLVGRWIALFGLVGRPLIFASAIAVLLGARARRSALRLLDPGEVFEAGITIYTLAKGSAPPGSSPAPPPAHRADP
jgi:Domain of unknown function (DUF4386)